MNSPAPHSLPPHVSSFLCLVLVLPLTFVSWGCSGNPPGYGSGPTPTAVTITTQPTSQTVPIGRGATLTAAAKGTAPISYQWSKNGAAIAGATGASYTTPSITLADSGSTFQVAISNAANTVTSNAVILTAGPRAPALGDLRYLLYQQVLLAGLGNYGGATTEIGAVDITGSNAVGTPLSLGSSYDCEPVNGCYYPLDLYYVPPGMTGYTLYYNVGNYDQFQSGIEPYTGSNVVIYSLDLEPGYESYGFAAVQTTQGDGFDYKMEAVPLSAVQATVAADGAESRIVTAISFDDGTGLVDVISYGWQGDASTAYETKTMIVAETGSTQSTFANVATASTALANSGYFISAFGGNDTDGYVVVGTRVMGDTMPRPVAVSTRNGTVAATNPDTAYFSTVVFLQALGDDVIVQEQ